MNRVAAVILAGGRGERLGGVNKALLMVGGKTLLDHALTATAECDLRLLSVGPEDWPAEGEIEHVRDLQTNYGGPLAGVAAVVDRLAVEPPDVLFSIAVDTPLFPRDFLSRATALLQTAPAVLASYAGQAYPTNALWRFEDIRGLADEVRMGSAPHSLKRLAERLGAVLLDYSPLTPSDPFRNANTPEDLAFLSAAMEHGRRG